MERKLIIFLLKRVGMPKEMLNISELAIILKENEKNLAEYLNNLCLEILKTPS